MSSRVPTNKKLFIVNSVASLVTRLLSITVLIWVQQFLIKRISVEEYSLLPLIFSLLMLLPFFSYILTGGLKRYVMEAYATHQDDRIAQIISSMLPFFLLAGILLLCIGGLLAWQIDKLLMIEPEYVGAAQLMLMLVISLEAIRLVAKVFSNGLFVKQKFVLESVIKITCEILRLSLLFLFLFGFSVSVLSVVVASVVAGSLEVIILLVASLKLLPQQKIKSITIDWNIVKELISFGGWSSLFGFSETVRKAADPIILNRLSTPVDVASFHLGSLVPNRLEILVNQSFMSSISPIIVGLNAENNDKKLKHLYLRLGRLLLWGLLLLISPLIIHYEQIVILYVGEKYSSAGVVMVLLLACFPFVYGNLLQRPLAAAKKRMRSLAYREVFSATLNLTLTLIFVGMYHMGAIGSALATFLVYGIGSLFIFLPFGKSLVNVTWREVWTEIFQPVLFPFVMALLSMQLLLSYMPAETWLAIFSNSVAGGIVYLIVLWLVSKDLDKAQFRTVMIKVFSFFRPQQ